MSLVNSTLLLACSGLMPLTESSRTSALNLARLPLGAVGASPSRRAFTAPVTASPLRSPNRLTMPSGT